MKPNDAQTWTWSPEQEPPQSFQDALDACPWVFSADFSSALIQGYAESITISGNTVRLGRPIIDYSDRSSGITLKSRYTQHPSYFIVNAPVVYWPRLRKESP